MAPIATLSRVGAGAGARVDKHNVNWYDTPKATATPAQQLQSHDSHSSSKQQLAQPLTRDARRILTNKTQMLIQEREKVDEALLRESQRDKANLTAEDWLPREKLLKMTKILANQERRHLQAQKKLITERQSLYKCDPSSERAIDLDLLRSLQWKFKKHLGTYLEDRERAFQPGDCNEDASSSSSSCSLDSSSDEDENVRTETSPGPDQVRSSQNEADPKPSDSEDDAARSISNLDGAHDSQVEPQTKKRKLADSSADSPPEKEQRKKTKEDKAEKEQTREVKNQAATSVSGSSSVESKVSSEDRHTDTKNNATFESMSQRNKPKVKGFIEEDITAKGQAALTNGSRVGVGSVATAKASGVEINVTSTNGVTISGAIVDGVRSNKSKIKTDDGPAIEPWYKIHARRMIEFDFDDCVYTRPRKRKNQGPTRQNAYLMSGAITDPPKGKRAMRSGLPSPPASSSSLSSDRADRLDKPRGEAYKSSYPKARKPVERPNIGRITKHGGKSVVSQDQNQAANSRSEPRLSPAGAGDP